MLQHADLYPNGFTGEMIECNGTRLHVVHNIVGEDDPRPPLMLLHGFPEFWFGWREVMPLLAQQFRVAVPDQRGCGASEVSPRETDYHARVLAKDMLTLTRMMFGEQPFHLVGHDFGASVAYAIALGQPELVSSLSVVNGAHPIVLQNELIDTPAQAEASKYFHLLRQPGAGDKFARNDFALTFKFLRGHSDCAWLTPEVESIYRSGWENAKRLDAMLNWYRQSPMAVPLPDPPIPAAALYNAPPEKFMVHPRHLLIWGEQDQALLPGIRDRLGDYCEDLTKINIPDGDHWVLHTHAALVAERLINFIDQSGT